MAVKTITIDLEAYGLLARLKKPGQSFSQVIKERLGRRMTGTDLAALVQGLPLSPDLADAVARQVRQRRKSRARAPRL